MNDMHDPIRLEFDKRMAIGEVGKMARGICAITSEILESEKWCGRDLETLWLRICAIQNAFRIFIDTETWALRTDMIDPEESDDADVENNDGECMF